MKMCGKKLLSVCLALVMLIAMVPAVNVTNVQAAKKEKLTLYKGEVLTESYYGVSVKSVSSSKKSVVSVKKEKGSKNKVDITAKKAGTATVTVKTTGATYKYTVTVKKLDVTGTLKDMGNGTLLLTVKNNTKQTFSYVEMTYTLKDENGETQVKDTKTISGVVAGKTVYSTISYSSYSYSIDLSKCSVKATGDDRSITATYKNASSKVKCTVKAQNDGEGDYVLTVKSKNTLKKQSVSGTNYIRVYDENGNLVYMRPVSFYLKGSGVDTQTCKLYMGMSADIDHYTYKVTTVAYYYTY
jgi:hypothetical protein